MEGVKRIDGLLPNDAVQSALADGLAAAQRMQAAGMIKVAYLSLQGEWIIVGAVQTDHDQRRSTAYACARGDRQPAERADFVLQ